MTTRIFSLAGVIIYIFAVYTTKTDAHDNPMVPAFLILVSGTARLIYVVVAGVVLWKIGAKRIAIVLPITTVLSDMTLAFLTAMPSAFNLVPNALKLVAFIAYIYALVLLFNFKSTRRAIQ